MSAERAIDVILLSSVVEERESVREKWRKGEIESQKPPAYTVLPLPSLEI